MQKVCGSWHEGVRRARSAFARHGPREYGTMDHVMIDTIASTMSLHFICVRVQSLVCVRLAKARLVLACVPSDVLAACQQG